MASLMRNFFVFPKPPRVGIPFIFYLGLFCAGLFFWYQTGRQSGSIDTVVVSQPSPTITPMAVNERETDSLSVRGNTLVTARGVPFLFHGVTSNVFRWSWPNENFHTTEEIATRFELVRQWGANAIQLYLNLDLFDMATDKGKDTMRVLEQVVDWGRKRGVWIILTPVNDVSWKSGYAQRTAAGLAKRDGIRNFLEQLAIKFGGYTHVLFSIEAEPKFIDTIQTIKDRVAAVRRHSNQPIFLPIYNFSGNLDLASTVRSGLIIDNIIIDYHPYRGDDKVHPGKTGMLTDLGQIDVDQYFYDRYPLVFGEVGGFWKGDFNSPQDIQAMTEMIQFARKRNISYFAYAIDDTLMPMFDTQGNVTGRGRAVKELLQAK